MRVCIIGNSHAVGLREGHQAEPSVADGFELTYIARSSRKFRRLGVGEHEGKVVFGNPHRSKALTIDTAAFDAFLLYGLDLFPYRRSRAFFSERALDQALNDHVESSVSVQILKVLSNLTRAPIVLGHNPLIATRGEETRGAHQDYAHGIGLLNDHVFSRYNAVLLAQPDETIVNGWSTAYRYSTGEKHRARMRRAGKARRENDDRIDFDHMVAEFGVIYLRTALDRLRRDVGALPPKLLASRAAARGALPDEVTSAPR